MCLQEAKKRNFPRWLILLLVIILFVLAFVSGCFIGKTLLLNGNKESVLQKQDESILVNDKVNKSDGQENYINVDSSNVEDSNNTLSGNAKSGTENDEPEVYKHSNSNSDVTKSEIGYGGFTDTTYETKSSSNQSQSSKNNEE